MIPPLIAGDLHLQQPFCIIVIHGCVLKCIDPGPAHRIVGNLPLIPVRRSAAGSTDAELCNIPRRCLHRHRLHGDPQLFCLYEKRRGIGGNTVAVCICYNAAERIAPLGKA